jgi:hypothetical protein
MIDRRTIFSPYRLYRYTLWREWDMMNPTFVQFIGLNPSTADEIQDDPTIRRCIDYAKRWGFGALCMTNAFAWRDTDPRKMKGQPHPIGPDNDRWLTAIAREAGVVVAAWGNHGEHMGRDSEICKLINNLHCLKITKNTGQPSHPLYLSKLLTPIPYAQPV